MLPVFLTRPVLQGHHATDDMQPWRIDQMIEQRLRAALNVGGQRRGGRIGRGHQGNLGGGGRGGVQKSEHLVPGGPVCGGVVGGDLGRLELGVGIWN